MFRSLYTKLLLGFLLVICAMGLLGSWAVISLYSIDYSTQEQVQHRLHLVTELSSLDTSLSVMRQSATRMMLRPDDTVSRQRLDVSEVKANHTLAGLVASETSKAVGHSFQPVLKLEELLAFLTSELRYQQSRTRSTGATYAEVFLSEIDPLFDSLRSNVTSLQHANLAQLESITDAKIERGRRLKERVLMWSGVVLVACTIFSIRFAHVIVNPIRELTEKTKRISAGELNQIVIPRTQDELGKLVEQFNAMAEKLGEFEELNLKKILEEKAISESIVQSMDDALILIDRAGTILSINRSAQDLFGLSGAEGKNCFEVSRGIPVLDELCGGAVRGTWQEKQRDKIVEYRHRNELMFLRRAVIPIRSGESVGTVAYLLIIRDVTKFYELDQMRSNFVGMVSHELRTPLTAIRMSVDLLAEPQLGTMTPVQAEFVQAIREESERLLRIVNDLMDLAKIESGKFEVRPLELNIGEFFAHLLIPFVAPAKEAGIQLDVEDTSNIKTVYADPDRLKQVFMNLVSNAMRYTLPGGSITVGVRRSARPGFAEFFVRDTGAGIPPEHLARIFQRFVVIRQDAKAGTGLGLAIAKEIVQAHGGTIQVRSEVGTGTEFWFTIPQQKELAASQASKSVTEVHQFSS